MRGEWIRKKWLLRFCLAFSLVYSIILRSRGCPIVSYILNRLKRSWFSRANLRIFKRAWYIKYRVFKCCEYCKIVTCKLERNFVKYLRENAERNPFLIYIYILVNLNLLYKIMLIYGQDVCSTDFSTNSTLYSEGERRNLWVNNVLVAC